MSTKMLTVSYEEYLEELKREHSKGARWMSNQFSEISREIELKASPSDAVLRIWDLFGDDREVCNFFIKFFKLEETEKELGKVPLS